MAEAIIAMVIVGDFKAERASAKTTNTTFAAA